MKKTYANREKGRWEYALTRPLSRIKFEELELMRADLFEYLDALTTDPYDDDRAWLNSEIQRIADRLKELTPRRARTLSAALKAGRVEYAYVSHEEEADRGPQCGPFSGRSWEELHSQYRQNETISFGAAMTISDLT
jgi:hypothetical protein